jgi:hypothetical protein
MLDPNILLIFLLLLVTKHTICDFFLQTMFHVKHKGTYFAWGGVEHSMHHALGTFVVCVLMTQSLLVGIAAAVFDFVFHYHIDYVKSKYGPSDMCDPAFWRWFGVDQAAHMLTYLVIIASIIAL